MKGSYQNIKIIVFAGYLLLFLLSVLGGYEIYRELLQFSKQNQPFAERKQLNLISNALVSLYELESIRKVMISENFNAHDLDSTQRWNSKKVHFYIDSLYRSTDDASIKTSLDTVNILLVEKEVNLKNMVALLDTIRKLPYSKRILTTVLSKKDINSLFDLFDTNFKTQKKDSSFFIKQKKGLLSRIKGVFVNEAESTKVVAKQNIEEKDTTIKKPAELLTDTVTQFIRDLSYRNNKKKVTYLSRLSVRQANMLYYDESLTNQIHQILFKLESKERKSVATLMSDRERAINKSTQLMSSIAWASLLTVIIFLTTTLILINQSQTYRKKIEESKKYAEDLMKSRERLLLMISHDIKSPLSSIIGHIELMLHEKMPQNEKDHLDNMKHSSEHILELVNKLMDYHKLEQGKSEITKVTFSPCELIESIYQSFEPVVNKKLSYKLKNDIDNGKNVESDPFVIKQIVNNLISNAIKFTKTGGITIASSISENNELRISVKDTGVGIKPEDITKIFDEFQRVGNTDDKNKIEGFGLGLAITYKLIKLLQGEIYVESEFGKGSEFTVAIPLATLQIPSETPALQKTDPKSVLKSLDAKVLFIDDDLVMLNVFEKLLQREGLKVTVCSDSKKVLPLLKKEKFGIILTDIQMPQINGFELVKQIRNINSKHYKEVPIVALSARSDISEDKFQSAGFTTFLSKPVPFTTLLDKIGELTNVTNNGEPKIASSAQTKGINALIEFVEDDEETAKDILNVFVSENKTKLDELKDSIQTNDWQQIKATSHKLLPLMRMIGADEMVKILVALENGEQNSEKVNILIGMLEEKNSEIIDFMNKKYPEV
ncbi:MAG: ATP-binding protein [Paludibacteraceae bacterium]